MKICKEIVEPAKRKAHPKESELVFGRCFTDHMLLIDYDQQNSSWGDAHIVPKAPFLMDPASLVLHYGQGVFEGMKAFRHPDGHVAIFRPRDHFERLNNSNRRLCIPELNIDDALEALYEFVRIDQNWIPTSKGTSLYLRPTVIASEVSLGIRVSANYRFFVIAGPVGSYYAEGFNPVKIWVEENYVRAYEGGLGCAKTMANYAASLYASQIAKSNGCAQVLWLDGREHRYVEEVGTMNMFFKINGEVLTAPLDGTILSGITRKSVIQLCKDWGIPISERRIDIQEVIEAQKNGTLEEAFGTGTAAVISPVGQLHFRDQDYTVADGQMGPFAKRVYNEITGIQNGTRPDPHNWCVRL